MSVPRTRRAIFSVRSIMVASLVFATVPILIFTGILLYRYADSEFRAQEARLISAARGIARAVDDEFETALTTLGTLKDADSLNRGDLDGFEARLRNTRVPGRRGFLLISPEGKVVIDTHPPSGAILPRFNINELLGVLSERGYYISDGMTDPGNHEPYAITAIPVVRNEKIRWILATHLYTDNFFKVISSPGVPDNWIVSIVDRHGTHIRRSTLNDEYLGKPLVRPLVRHMEEQKTGVIRTVSHEGIALSSTVAYGPLSGYAAAIGVPVDSLEAPLWRFMQSLTIAGLLLVAAALLLAFLIARFLIDAFRKIRRSVESVNRGEVVDTEPSAIPEINDVITAISVMSRNLSERTEALNRLNNSLEAEVAERTRALVEEMNRREESEARLQHMERIEAIGQLTGGIAHDFNNMMSVVISGLELTKRRLAQGSADVEQYVEGAMQGARSAARLTERLLAFSRQQNLKPEAVDCNALLSEIREILQRTIPENIDIQLYPGEGLWLSHMDATGLENTIINLALNARDAMPDGGPLTISTENVTIDPADAASMGEIEAGDYILIRVADAGEGIAPEALEHIFEPFFTTKPPGKGSGLGLSQVHGFIKQSGGHVRIQSEIDQGTTVMLYLPRQMEEDDATARRAAAPTAAEGVPTATAGETILLVEDDQTVRDSAEKLLSELGYTVISADGGENALDLLEANSNIRLLMSDVVMPNMTGPELAEKVKERRPDIKILYTTGYADKAFPPDQKLADGVDLLMKPYSFDALARKLNSLLSS